MQQFSVGLFVMLILIFFIICYRQFSLGLFVMCYLKIDV